ncbi:MAG TPA: phosphatase PAP2 family protein [Candidatus Bilamarchaeaceae archaeon]|nr:phosphatase PAP2 family protein [Candidatus Bilamarchaeaceae archaeon]
MDPAAQAFVTFAQFLDNPYAFFSIIILLVLATEPRNGKRMKIALALLIAGLITLGAKAAIMQPRPCIGSSSLIDCPLDYSMPSGHAAIAFTLMLAFIGHRFFPLYWVFAILVAYTRFYLGVHTFEDIAAALVAAPIAYQLADIIWGALLEGKK